MQYLISAWRLSQLIVRPIT